MKQLTLIVTGSRTLYELTHPRGFVDKNKQQKVLDQGLPEAFTRDLFEAKSEAVFQHVYDSYYGDGKSVYTAVA